MSMADVKVFWMSLDGTVRRELTGVSVSEPSWKLNDIGTATLNVHPLRPAATWLYNYLNKCEVQVWIGNQLRWWGVPRSCSIGKKQLSFQCEDLLSHFVYRNVRATLTYTSIDQFNIGWNLMSYAQTGTNRDRRVVAGAYSPSGRVRSREYLRDEHPNILQALQEFPGLEGGFDFEIKIFGDGRREWWPYFPIKGNVYDELRLEWGRNIVDIGGRKDGSEQGTEVWALGGTNGDIRFEAIYEDTGLSADYGVLEKIVSEGTQNDVDWLLDRATDEVAAYGEPVEIPELTVIDLENVPLDGVLEPGDIVPVVIDYGALQFNSNYRIIQITRVGPGKLKLTFNRHTP
jgi:hypothetical protein